MEWSRIRKWPEKKWLQYKYLKFVVTVQYLSKHTFHYYFEVQLNLQNFDSCLIPVV